jgi:hypothetical protein
MHLDDANALIAILNKNNNLYDDDSISNSYINWDGSAAWTNCSTFATILLKHTYGWTDGDFSFWWQSTSPSAAKYHDLIQAGNRFTQIFDRDQIQAGDFIAIKYPAGGSSTGHLMMVAGDITARTASNPVVAGTTQYEVPVIDSSSSYHGTTDTRHPTQGGGGEGIGKGVFRIYVDANNQNQIVGYTWSTANGTYYDQSAPAATLRHLMVGRLQ